MTPNCIIARHFPSLSCTICDIQTKCQVNNISCIIGLNLKFKLAFFILFQILSIDPYYDKLFLSERAFEKEFNKNCIFSLFFTLLSLPNKLRAFGLLSLILNQFNSLLENPQYKGPANDDSTVLDLC